MKKSIAKAQDSSFVIGIDLGTTQCALSYIGLTEKKPVIKVLPVKQHVENGQIEELSTLLSAIYIDEQQNPAPEGNWSHKSKYVLGVRAQELGKKIPSRYVHSSKSWLCHPKAVGTSPILPWQSESITDKISPVQAGAMLVKHLIHIWNNKFCEQNEAYDFYRQKIVVTVPASFDPSARNYTLEAIKEAGATNVMLLEEPQAVFYDYLHKNSQEVTTQLKAVETVLVIDIGGGTTDFSLIKISWQKDSEYPEFTRLAVGPHLLIGGDNLDMALARNAEMLFKHKGHRIRASQWQALLHQCRVVKEKVLSEEITDKVTFTISGAGKKVLAGTAKVEMSVDKIMEILIEGFFPVADVNDKPEHLHQTGISEAGLPFTRDIRITRHLANFLSENDIVPDAVLFNGGTMKANQIKQRITEILSLWKNTELKVLDNPQPTLAVSSGAACYAMADLGLKQRIESTCPVSLYLGIGSSNNKQKHTPAQVVCILQRGSKPEITHELDNNTFGIDLSRDCAFYMYYTPSPPKSEHPGRQVRFNQKRYLPLPPCTIKAKTAKGEKQVKLSVKLRETGYLEMFCNEIDGNFSHELKFDIATAPQKTDLQNKSQKLIPISKSQFKKITQIPDQILRNEIEPDKIFKKLEEILESSRNTWDAHRLRQIFDIFSKEQKTFFDDERKMSMWFRVLGFCLRPGYGVEGDPSRVDFIWQMTDLEQKFENNELRSDWWVLLKRLSPGLSLERQIALFERAKTLLFPTKKTGSRIIKVSKHERGQLWRLIGNLERIPVEFKENLGDIIVKSGQSYGIDALAMYTLGRLGARELAYAPETAMVSQKVVENWTQTLLRRANPGHSYLDWAMREIARKTGDRMVQVDDLIRKKVHEVLKQKSHKKQFLQPLLKVRVFNSESIGELIGETLPSGFIWAKQA